MNRRLAARHVPDEDGLTVLNYHNFTRSPSISRYDTSVDDLREDLQEISGRWQPVQLIEALERLASGKAASTERPAIAVTADDGDRGVLEVLPLFERYQVPLVLFLPTGLVLGRGHPDGLRSFLFRTLVELRVPPTIPALQSDDPSEVFAAVQGASERVLWTWLAILSALPAARDPLSANRFLSAEDLSGLARHPLVTFGAHSMSHQRLASLVDPWAHWEIEQSLRWVEAFGGTRDLFAYPYGAAGTFDVRTDRILREKRVRYAFSTMPDVARVGRIGFVIGRFTIFRSTRD
jgi:peptidoglycan/xylan/chitin deacetylase (PgdA/CDA1 family)